MGINTMIESLRHNLANDINECHLPVGIIYYVIKDVFYEVEKGYLDAVKSESVQNIETDNLNNNNENENEEINIKNEE